MSDASLIDQLEADGESKSGKPGRAVARRSSWRLLEHRDFRLYFVGSLGSNLGTWLQNTVQVLLAYQFTHSAFYVGLVVAAQFAGTLFLSPWAAVLADRIGARRTLIGAQVISAMIALTMCLAYRSGLLNEKFLVIGALGLGVAFALALPVQTALVPTLVSEDDTESAMAMNSVSYNSGRALAPALAVLVIAFLGPDWIFAINAASFVLFAIALLFLAPEADFSISRVGDDQSRARVRVMDGIRIARRSRRLMLLLAIVAAVTFADDPIQVLSPGVAHVMHIPGGWAAYFIAALGWGTVFGSFGSAVRRKTAERGKVPNPEDSETSQTSRRAAIWLLVLVVSVIVFALALSPWISLLAALSAGAAALFTGATTQALIVGAHRKGAASVAGLWAIAWAGTKPIASLCDGWLASHVYLWLAAAILTLPAGLLAFGELVMPRRAKTYLKSWSLRGHLESRPPSCWTFFLYVCHSVLAWLGLEPLPTSKAPVGTVGEVAVADREAVREPV